MCGYKKITANKRRRNLRRRRRRQARRENDNGTIDNGNRNISAHSRRDYEKIVMGDSRK